jgi:C-terminal processing protease CtpA/Prc
MTTLVKSAAVIALVGWAVSLAAAANAQLTSPSVPPASQPELSADQLRILVSQLADRSYRVREAASQKLAQADFRSVDLLIPLYKNLTQPEQKLRLRSAVEQMFVADKRSGNQPEGFVGVGHVQIYFDKTDVRGNVRTRVAAWVNNVLADSPAARGGLQNDDMILAVDGKPLDENPETAFANRVRHTAPGAKIELTVQRGEEEKKIVIKLDDRRRYATTEDLIGWHDEFAAMWRQKFDPNEPAAESDSQPQPILIRRGGAVQLRVGQ